MQHRHTTYAASVAPHARLQNPLSSHEHRFWPLLCQEEDLLVKKSQQSKEGANGEALPPPGRTSDNSPTPRPTIEHSRNILQDSKMVHAPRM